MSTKEKILEVLDENKGKYFSGEELAKSLGISRNSVWKGIKNLREEGYNIHAVTNKGYSLLPSSDVLSLQSLQRQLSDTEFHLEFFSSINSTNNYVIEQALNGAKEGLLVVSEKQEKGKGRRGRSFYSPKNTGVYFSLLLRPNFLEPDRVSSITTMAAVSVCEAIEQISGKEVGIKWVNDVFIDNKKVCGILTEASYDMESKYWDYVVLGIGINVYYPEEGFPKDIKNIAGAIFNEPVYDGKSRIVAQTIKGFWDYYKNIEKKEYVKSYKKNNIVVGREITVISSNGEKKAKALDIDDECRLVVEYEDGKVDSLFSGEISIRL